MTNKLSFSLFALATVLILFIASSKVNAQTGLSVSPPRTYFTLNPGQSETKQILVSNPSKTTTLELSVSFSDWEYDGNGNNVMAEAGVLDNSCAEWIDILPQSFFSVAPGASYELDVRMKVPENLSDSVPVHTSMLFITQINPTDGVNEQGANIKIAVRSGVKIYHRKSVKRDANVDITNFAYEKENPNQLKFAFKNIGNVWTDGTITCELLNQNTGKKTKLEDAIFYSMPGDKRELFFKLPEDLNPSKYIATAIFDYEHAASVKMAELSFDYEK
ncbi:MAG: molecular chaperone [Phycisphaerae bacterium]